MTEWEPSYLALHRSGELRARAGRAMALLDGRCLVCPRLCKVDRLADKPGLCGVGRRAVVAPPFLSPSSER
jgi:putative pyruvate formate lyase activating enzyme